MGVMGCYLTDLKNMAVCMRRTVRAIIGQLGTRNSLCWKRRGLLHACIPIDTPTWNMFGLVDACMEYMCVGDGELRKENSG